MLLKSWTTIVVHDKQIYKNPNITHTKNHPKDKDYTEKASKIFFCNTSVQQSALFKA